MTRLSWSGRVSRAWERRHELVDALVVLITSVSVLVPDTEPTLIADWSPGGVEMLPFAVLVGAAARQRRRRPLLLATVALVTMVTARDTGLVVLPFGLYALGAYERSRWVSVTMTVLSALALSAPAAAAGQPEIAVLAMVGCVAPVLLGLWVGARRALVLSLRERAERAERERHLLAEQARNEERARIAREMHDVVAHRVSLMVLHAGALEVADAGGQGGRTAGLVRSIGHEALEELRDMVRVLRGETEPSESAVPLAPQPTLDDLKRLVEDSRSAGLRVTLEVDAERPAVPAVVERAAYRVVQEALTNVHKHAGDVAAQVCVIATGGALRVTVTNHPRPRQPSTLPSGGHGLVGLRERVRLLGGELTAGPLLDGSWRVHAWIPLDAARVERATR